MKISGKALVPVAILAVAFVGAGIMLKNPPETEQQSPQVRAPLVRVATVQPREIQFVVRTHGTVVPRTESDLIPQVSGEVVWISPELVPGGFFEAGQPLARIDRGDYEADLESARAAVARTSSELARARKERERQQQLLDRSVASQSRIDDAENRYRVTQAELREAKARLTRAERDLERTELRAPYEGRVRTEQVDVGQFVSRGTSIARLYAVDYAEVRLPLPDRELRYVNLPLSPRGAVPGAKSAPLPEVVLRAEFAGERLSWRGQIVRSEGELDPKSRMVHVVARVKDPYGRRAPEPGPPLAVGMFVEAEIQGHRIAGAFELPRGALREGERGIQDRVYIVEDDSRLRFQKVQVLRAERENVVIGEGLAPGDRVLISPLQVVVEGMEVRLAEPAPTAAGQAPALAEAGP